MNAHSFVRNALLTAVIAGIAWFAIQEVRQAKATEQAGLAAEAEPASAANQQPHVVMTYFTTNVRCASCRKIEALARETAEVHHAAAIANGRLFFQVINTDDPGMAHYISEYELVSKTVVLSRRENGKELEWKNMGDVWSHFNAPESFHAYLAEQLREWGVM